MCTPTVPAGVRKTCKKCGESKLTNEFNKHSRKPDGLNIYCKVCWRDVVAKSDVRKKATPTVITTPCGLTGARKTHANRPCLWETHPELAASLADPAEGFMVSMGTGKNVTWKCTHNVCNETHEYRIPDKIIRGDKCVQCRPMVVTGGLREVQKNIVKSLVRSVRSVGLDYCSCCEGVFSIEKMEKSSCRRCKACASKKMTEYNRENPDYTQKRNAARRRRARSIKGTFSRQQWKARLDYFGNKCVYCGCEGKMTLDHKIPISKGGTNWPSNFVPACRSCNSSKNAKGFLEFKESLKKG
jgi:5-methylcytosine-specific restriction endonuclease McrA